MFGRRRYFPEINAEHPLLRSRAERMAVNLPVQGTEADLMKLAMIKIDKKLKELNLINDVKMLLQVHDELLFEVKDSKIKAASVLIKETMENIAKLKAPIEVHIGIGKNWKATK
jgi:DNA polymerase-1